MCALKSCLSVSRRVFLTGAVLTGLLIVDSPVQAQPAENKPSNEDAGKLDSVIKELAGDLQKYLTNDVKSKSIAIGAFTGQPQLAASSGVVIKKKLTEQLTSLGIDCTRRASFSCKGEYFFQKDDSVVLIRTYVAEGTRRLITREKKIYNVGDVSALLGLTGQLPVDNPEKRKEGLANSVTKPEVTVTENKSAEPPKEGPPPKTLISASKTSLYSMEICVKDKDGKYIPMPVTNDEGLAFVDLNLENIYAVRLINNSKFPAAVKLTIDGLNMFEFSTRPDYKALGVVIIPPRAEGYLIKGWHITDQVSDSFLVTEYAKSIKGQLAEKVNGVLKSDDDVGTITASFAIALPPGAGPPPDEPNLRSLGTKRGPPVDAIYKPMPVRIGTVREVISVRYARDLPPPG